MHSHSESLLPLFLKKTLAPRTKKLYLRITSENRLKQNFFYELKKIYEKYANWCKKYDLIRGPVANDDVYRTVTLYLSGVLSRSATLAELKVRKLYNQVVFASDKALSYLSFHLFYEVAHE